MLQRLPSQQLLLLQYPNSSGCCGESDFLLFHMSYTVVDNSALSVTYTDNTRAMLLSLTGHKIYPVLLICNGAIHLHCMVTSNAQSCTHNCFFRKSHLQQHLF